ncbi:MAG: hypothetical protein ACYDEH_02150 [Acidimicrobiales bacterium]
MNDDHIELLGATSSAADHDHRGGVRRTNHMTMIACCIPVLLIAVVLVATHVVSASAIVIAVGCVVMMAFMMRGMNHDHGGH